MGDTSGLSCSKPDIYWFREFQTTTTTKGQFTIATSFSYSLSFLVNVQKLDNGGWLKNLKVYTHTRCGVYSPIRKEKKRKGKKEKRSPQEIERKRKNERKKRKK